MNNPKIPVAIGLAAVTALVALWLVFTGMGYQRQAVDLETRAAALQEVNLNTFDAMWKIIEGQAGVASAYKKDFGEVYGKIIDGRYSHGGGQMMQWIQEHNPEFDASLYKQVSASIEAQRTKFLEAQNTLEDVAREHQKLRLSPPSSWFVGSRPEIKVTRIRSERTKDAARTGEDNASPDPFAARAK